MANYADYDVHMLEEARRMIVNALNRVQKELEEVDEAIERKQKSVEQEKQGAAA